MITLQNLHALIICTDTSIAKARVYFSFFQISSCIWKEKKPNHAGNNVLPLFSCKEGNGELKNWLYMNYEIK